MKGTRFSRGWRVRRAADPVRMISMFAPMKWSSERAATIVVEPEQSTKTRASRCRLGCHSVSAVLLDCAISCL